MRFIVHPSSLHGEVDIPTSKSHTIRALLIGAMADGVSHIRAPLNSADTRACRSVCEQLGVSIVDGDDGWAVSGLNGRVPTPENVLDVGNSGTTLYLAMGLAALGFGWTVFTGDEQIRRRTGQPLLDALNQLGARAYSTRGNGCAPFIIGGPMKGGEAELEARSSQYVSSLLLSTPLADGDSHIRLRLLNEQPYVGMTLRWLAECGVRVEAAEDLMQFEIRGGQRFSTFDKRVPGDFSSATFFLCAGAVTGAELVLRGLDMTDSQGDKAVVPMLQEMGARIELTDEGVRTHAGPLRGADLDLNATPDALPSMAVVGCFAEGTTRLLNVPQARIKETDRIATTAAELRKMGARIEELEDGLVVHQSELRGAVVDGHGDHRLVMALSVAGLAASGVTTVLTAESAGVTFPTFAPLMQRLGAGIEEAPDA